MSKKSAKRRRNQCGEPWRVNSEGELVNADGVLLIDAFGFLRHKERDRTVLAVTACAGLTAAELRRGVVPQEG